LQVVAVVRDDHRVEVPDAALLQPLVHLPQVGEYRADLLGPALLRRLQEDDREEGSGPRLLGVVDPLLQLGHLRRPRSDA
jgi:hypothetical protein